MTKGPCVAVIAVAAATLSGCCSPSGEPTITTLFDQMSVLDGSGLIGPVINHRGDNDEYSHEAYLEVFGDPDEVWLAYQSQLAETYQVDVPSGLEACWTTDDRASCSLDGYASVDGETTFVRLRMWQPRQDFAGRYVIKIEAVPGDYDSPDPLGALEPSEDETDQLEQIPPPREANASPPNSGQEIGNGTLNDAYTLPLPEGASVVRNLESGLGVDGISAYLQIEPGVDAAAIAVELADQLCGYDSPVDWQYDDHAFTFIECEGVAGDNPGSFHVIETPEHGTYLFFTVYID